MSNTYKSQHGWKRMINAIYYSWKGLCATYRYEAPFREEVWLSVALIPLGFWLGDNSLEKVLLVGSVVLVLIVEVLNSAIESVVDRVSSEKHELSGRAKDQGSAAVFIAILLCLLTWFMLLFKV